MTGWRLGWIVSKENHIQDISKLAMNFILAHLPFHNIQQYKHLITIITLIMMYKATLERETF